jgi:hypothetical protein
VIRVHTVTGDVDLTDLRSAEITLDALLCGLSQSRWAGQSPVPITIAQHSIAVAAAVARPGVPVAAVLAALLHHRGSAFVGDVLRPIGMRAPWLRDLEDDVAVVVAEALRVDGDVGADLVRGADAAERGRELGAEYEAWSWVRARDELRDYLVALLVLAEVEKDPARWTPARAPALVVCGSPLEPEYVTSLFVDMVAAGVLDGCENGYSRRGIGTIGLRPVELGISVWLRYEIHVEEMQRSGRDDAWIAGWLRGAEGHDWAGPEMLGLRRPSGRQEMAWHLGYRHGADERARRPRRDRT